MAAAPAFPISSYHHHALACPQETRLLRSIHQYPFPSLLLHERAFPTLVFFSGAIFPHRWRSQWRRKTAYCSRKTPLLQPEMVSDVQLDEILGRISLALGVQSCLTDVQFIATGKETCFGLDGDWQFRWGLNGQFYEHFDCEEMEFQYGFDGDGSPWHADAGGHVSDLELDNSEACLLALWVRTGFWITEQGQQRLLIKKVEKCFDGDALEDNGICLSISLKGKKVESHVLIDSTTWLPQSMQLKAFGGIEKWEFIGWKSLMQSEMTFKLPMLTLYWPACGGKHSFQVENFALDNREGNQSLPIFTRPSTPFLSRNKKNFPRIHLDKTLSPSVKMIRVRSGHHLVSPLIEGVNIGYFIVDTGASGLVISGKKADEVNMSTFGEVFITGIGGKCKTCFRRGERFELGPFTIHNPIFIQSPSDEVVRGVTEPVAGICGYDLFCQTIVEMASAEFRMSFYDPSLYIPHRSQMKWEVLYMLDNTPHAEVKFKGQRALLMLDTGAGGIDIIFHKRAVEEFNLRTSLTWRGAAEVTGVGTGSVGIKVEQATLDSVEVAGHTFSRVQALHFSADEQTLDISIYTSGVVCGELILKHIAIFDYRNRRYALVQP